MAARARNELARRLKSLCKAGDPLVLTNVYDIPTARIVASHHSTKALATASYAIAETSGVPDNDLSREDNIARILQIATIAKAADFPLTVDLQDGYDDVSETITQAIAAGAVGCNLEDTSDQGKRMRSIEEAASRVKMALDVATACGIPDFVVNARTDTLGHGGSIFDAIERGRAYLAAGAVTVYIWGGLGGRGVSRSEIVQLVAALDGMVNVRLKLSPGYLKAAEIKQLGVARMSIGPDLYFKAMAGFKQALETDFC